MAKEEKKQIYFNELAADGGKQALYSQRLRDHFNAVSSTSDRCRNRKITVSKELYETYLKLYFRSLQLCRMLENILKDGEHQLCMEEGQSEGWHLPHHNYMYDDVHHLKSVLKEMDPFASMPRNGGSHVRISTNLAVQMHHLLQINILMSAKLFDMFRKSEYLPYHRHLRDKGIKYAGPTSLSEIVNTYMQSAHTHKKTQKYLKKLDIPQDWHKRIIA